MVLRMNAIATIHGNSRYSLALAEAVCESIGSGMTLSQTAEAHGIERTTICTWANKHDEFAKLYAQAKLSQLDQFADDVVTLSDEAQGMDAAGVQASKLRTDNRKWILSKLRADVYGDKLDVTSAGKALATPVHQVDARVQSIIMMAAERMRLATGVELSDEAKSLLD